MGRQNPDRHGQHSSDRKEQFAVRLSKHRADVIRRHLRLYDDATKADALRAAVDALQAKHREAGGDASRKKFRDAGGGSGLGAGGTESERDIKDDVEDDVPPSVARLLQDDDEDISLDP